MCGVGKKATVPIAAFVVCAAMAALCFFPNVALATESETYTLASSDGDGTLTLVLDWDSKQATFTIEEGTVTFVENGEGTVAQAGKYNFFEALNNAEGYDGRYGSYYTTLAFKGSNDEDIIETIVVEGDGSYIIGNEFNSVAWPDVKYFYMSGNSTLDGGGRASLYTTGYGSLFNKCEIAEFPDGVAVGLDWWYGVQIDDLDLTGWKFDTIGGTTTSCYFTTLELPATLKHFGTDTNAMFSRRNNTSVDVVTLAPGTQLESMSEGSFKSADVKTLIMPYMEDPVDIDGNAFLNNSIESIVLTCAPSSDAVMQSLKDVLGTYDSKVTNELHILGSTSFIESGQTETCSVCGGEFTLSVEELDQDSGSYEALAAAANEQGQKVLAIYEVDFGGVIEAAYEIDGDNVETIGFQVLLSGFDEYTEDDLYVVLLDSDGIVSDESEKHPDGVNSGEASISLGNTLPLAFAVTTDADLSDTENPSDTEDSGDAENPSDAENSGDTENPSDTENSGDETEDLTDPDDSTDQVDDATDSTATNTDATSDDTTTGNTTNSATNSTTDSTAYSLLPQTGDNSLGGYILISLIATLAACGGVFAYRKLEDN